MFIKFINMIFLNYSKLFFFAKNINKIIFF